MGRARGSLGAGLFALNGGCIGFIEVLMLSCYLGKQLQIARRLIMVG